MFDEFFYDPKKIREITVVNSRIGEKSCVLTIFYDPKKIRDITVVNSQIVENRCVLPNFLRPKKIVKSVVNSKMCFDEFFG